MKIKPTIPYILVALFIPTLIAIYWISVPIGLFFTIHWYGALAMQSFFHHRYSAHGTVVMSKRTEKLFFIISWILQGSSFLNPRAYGIMHRMHHDFSDTKSDPHSPHFFKDIFGMMWHTKKIYIEISDHPDKYEKWDTKRPIWSWFEKMGESLISRLSWGISYSVFYLIFLPSGHEYLYLLLPIHWLMNPFHGALVNWCGHKYGYRNYEDTNDKSVNCLPLDIMLLGEWFQNNHHQDKDSPNLAKKWWEFNPLYPAIWFGAFIGLYKFNHHENL
ncbi:MAG TPA: hypothetical protein PKD96_00435 [Candidatus Absconditabacterales bacterium]|nr:hypothetical protein [Candidatus Absconditabacterales bacterium]HMT26747.1 hypothetical protein [Candidatus Absconditabacterales bacterium]